MNFKRKNLTLYLSSFKSRHLLSKLFMAQMRTTHSDSQPLNDGEDDILCSGHHQQKCDESQEQESDNSDASALCMGSPRGYLTGEARIERAWSHWSKLGRPKLIVAPMVDNSELPFRMLCRKFGAEAAYTPMLHSRIFTETEKYRDQEFTTCKVYTTFCSFTFSWLMCSSETMG